MSKQRLPSGACGQWAVWEGRLDFNKNGDVCSTEASQHLPLLHNNKKSLRSDQPGLVTDGTLA